jgi:hypothetical protein
MTDPNVGVVGFPATPSDSADGVASNERSLFEEAGRGGYFIGL